MNSRTSIILVFFIALSGCVTDFEILEWPEEGYPRNYFEAAFQEDDLAQQYQSEDDYMLWVTRFYNGYSLAPGWLSLTEQVKDRLDEPYRSEVAAKLYILGGRIGSEWAKDNAVRVLDTRNAAVWRDALVEALSQNDLDNYIIRVEEDIGRLFTGDLKKEDITFERYFISVDDFEF
ncbi:hypothetical protein N9E57_05290 [Gammaproteobacteria bacterium]|nr:hypothetical protein [Gammaproteobacteria bacterium]